jgi:DNA-binding MarR family transcriptional regulator
MENIQLRLTNELLKMYKLPVINQLYEFIQGELSVLFALSKLTENVSPKDTLPFLSFSKARLTKILASLKKKEYINLKKSSIDNRMVNITLTESGRNFVSAKEQNVQQIFEYLINNIGDDVANKFVKILEEINEVMKGYHGNN